MYTLTICLYQHGVSAHSIIDFLGGALEAPPPSDPENLHPLCGRVKCLDHQIVFKEYSIHKIWATRYLHRSWFNVAKD